MKLLAHLGVKSVPVISLGEKWIFAQDLKVVAEFCGIEKLPEKLPPATLVDKLDMVISGAQRFIAQMPPERLNDMLPGRPRPYRDLFYHIFVIPDLFVDAARDGKEITEKGFEKGAPEGSTVESIVAYGEEVKKRVHDWWDKVEDKNLDFMVPTYYGEHTAHDTLERTTWHAGQHVRQVMFIHGTLGVRTNQPLTDQDFAGLPMPKSVWDG